MKANIFHCTKAVQIVFEMCMNELKAAARNEKQAKATKR